jgi:hypothetical protein
VVRNQRVIYFFCEKGNENVNYVHVFFFFARKGIESAVTRPEFVSDRTTNKILKGRWYHIIVLKIHA